jgi:hypothetical protein
MKTRFNTVVDFRTIVAWFNEVPKDVSAGAPLMPAGWYFVSRPPGHVSAHGYAEEPVREFDRIGKLGQSDENPAVTFIRRLRRIKAACHEGVLGYRVATTCRAAEFWMEGHTRVDLDELLVKYVRETFTEVERSLFPGESLGYFLRIDHALDAASPAITVEVLLLPHTNQGTPVQVTKEGIANGSGKVFRFEAMMGWPLVYALASLLPDARPANVDANWIALAEEVCYHAYCDFRRNGTTEDN